MNLWLSLNQATTCANLQYYSNVQDPQLHQHWQDGWHYAHMKVVHIGLVSVLEKVERWTCPWPISMSETLKGQRQLKKQSQ